ncbi:MAG: hypothetical protein ACK2TU_11555, partial [Anaerolineales bacterium]
SDISIYDFVVRTLDTPQAETDLMVNVSRYSIQWYAKDLSIYNAMTNLRCVALFALLRLL